VILSCVVFRAIAPGGLARAPVRYRTTKPSSDEASLRKRWSLRILREKEMTSHAPTDGSPGRPAAFSDESTQFGPTIKLQYNCRCGKSLEWWPA
jgi:hypothetical protein